MNRYYPRRPVKSFQDLEVYQKTYGLGVEIVKKLAGAADTSEESLRNTSQESGSQSSSDGCPERSRMDSSEVDGVTGHLSKVVLRLPKLLVAAHSVRFGRPQQAIDSLEKAMLDCNLAVYYLSLVRDLGQTKIKTDYFEEQVKEYLRVRGKIMRLQRAWLRFMEAKND